MRFSVVAAALVAVLVGFGGTLAIIVAAAQRLGAGPAEVTSWISAECVGMGVSSILLSTWTRIPVVTAWSLAGAVLVVGLPEPVPMADGIGAFLFSGVLMVLAGAVPALGALVARLPPAIGAAMLAGLLLRFVLTMFGAAQAEPLLVLPLLLVFLVARRFHAASAPLVVLALGLPFAALLGHAVPTPEFGLGWWRWTTPGFTPTVLIGLGIPFFLVTMATQQIPGAAVIRVAGYVPPTRLALVVTGAITVLLSPFGGYSTNLSSITAAICTGVEAHPDPARRWLTGPVYGLSYLVLALFGAGVAAMIGRLPAPLIAVVAGAALLGPLVNAFTVAVAVERERLAAVVAFAVTASGVTLLGLGGAFWGLVAGVVVLGLERRVHPAAAGLNGAVLAPRSGADSEGRPA